MQKEPTFYGIKYNSNGDIKSFTSHHGFFANNLRDKYCIVRHNIPVEILEFTEDKQFKVNVFINPQNLFIKPVHSKKLVIFLVDSSKIRKNIFEFHEITGKLVGLPYENKLLLIKLVHSS